MWRVELSAELLATIKSQPALVARLESLKEVNVEVLATEARSFSTGNPLALQTLFGEHAHTSPQCVPSRPSPPAALDTSGGYTARQGDA